MHVRTSDITGAHWEVSSIDNVTKPSCLSSDSDIDFSRERCSFSMDVWKKNVLGRLFWPRLTPHWYIFPFLTSTLARILTSHFLMKVEAVASSIFAENGSCCPSYQASRWCVENGVTNVLPFLNAERDPFFKTKIFPWQHIPHRYLSQLYFPDNTFHIDI